MKTSNKILIAAFLVFVAGLVTYNVNLKAEYLTGKYKNPYSNFKNYAIKGFNEVEINGVSLMDVEFKQGDFAVRKAGYSEDSITFTKVGNRLIVNVSLTEAQDTTKQLDEDGFPVRRYQEFRTNRIVIRCPNLSLIKTTDVYLVNGKKLNYFVYDNNSDGTRHRVIIFDKFNLDTLSIIQTGSGAIDMGSNKINVLKVNTGSKSSIQIFKTNKIENAHLEIGSNAELWLDNIAFPKLTYHISDSANVTLIGSSLKGFIKQ